MRNDNFSDLLFKIELTIFTRKKKQNGIMINKELFLFAGPSILGEWTA